MLFLTKNQPLEALDFLNVSFVDVIDIVLVALLLYSLYRLVRGTVAINIFIGIVIIYLIWKLTDALKMDVLSNILGKFISVGFFALIVVFQQEIRKFLLLIGSTNFTNRRNVIRYFKFLNLKKDATQIDIVNLLDSCERMAKSKTGAIIVIERSNSLDFLHHTGQKTRILLDNTILETIFFKNSPLHDGAVVIKENNIVATRVILPVSENKKIPAQFGLRHRAALGISEKTDALVLVISEQSGEISLVKDGAFVPYKNLDDLRHLLTEDLSA